ncbi:MAG TPA: glycoside hydrolase family 20 zincin-like fold domain-containing protein [Tepidisphaeraceae bacterium]|jgi:hypothetical protein|nr:glycoside hydrolase family 20 zincin-like fold domain-containing protein [Tepidisphaeraceae bacterium]
MLRRSICIGVCGIVLGVAGASALRADDGPATSPPQRAPVPDAAELGRRQKAIREIFKDDYQKKSSADRAALARKLILQSEDGTTDRADGYVLLQQGCELAIEAGDTAGAIWATSRITQLYAVNEWQTRLTTLRSCAKAAATPRANSALAIGAIELFDDLVAAGEIEDAARAISLAESASKKSEDPMSTQASHDRETRMRALRTGFEQFQKAAAALRENPNSAADNLAAGKFLCFTKGDWDHGLPMLTKGSDARLKQLAGEDLLAPADAEAQKRIADAWWDAGKAAEPEGRQRAAYWYRRALPGLGGLSRKFAQKRIDEFQSAAPGSQRIVDLLARFDPGRDVVHGKWTFHDGEIASGEGGDTRVELPYVPGEEYDFRVVFTRVSGNFAFDQLGRLGDQSFEWEIGYDHNTVYGFQDLDGAHIDRNGSAVRVPKCIENGRTYVSIVKVRKGRIEGWVNGQLVKSIDVPGIRLSLPEQWLLRHPECLGVGTFDSPTTFHAIEVIEVTGKGKLLR